MRQSSETIGTLKEGGLHRALKTVYAHGGGEIECRVGSYVVDVLDGDCIIEIQTSNFGSLRTKLDALLETHSVTVVYPILAEKTLVKHGANGVTRRKSPKRGAATDVFDELVYVPAMLDQPNLELELIHVSVEEHRRKDPRRAWRRRHWVVTERKLVSIGERERFASMAQLFGKFEAKLPDRFTTMTIAEKLSMPRTLARKFAYCFREAGVVKAVEKEGNAIVYQRACRH